MKPRKYVNIILSVLLIALLGISIWQNIHTSRLSQSLDQLDSRISTEFDGAKHMLSFALRDYEYSPLLTQSIDELLPKSRTNSFDPWRQHAVGVFACGDVA